MTCVKTITKCKIQQLTSIMSKREVNKQADSISFTAVKYKIRNRHITRFLVKRNGVQSNGTALDMNVTLWYTTSEVCIIASFVICYWPVRTLHVSII